jgi:hypothetical protein
MSTFKRRPSSLQIVLTLAEEDEVVPGEDDGNGSLNGHYTKLQARLKEMGVEIQEGLSPAEMYREAARYFKRSKSSHQSESNLDPVQKLEAEVG